MFCRKCGAQQLDDSRFCPKCGAKVEPDGTAAADPTAPEPDGGAPAPSSPEKTPETEPAPQGDSSPLMFSPDQDAASAPPPTTAPPQSSQPAASSTPAEPANPAAPSSTGDAGGALPESLLPKPDGFGNPNERERVEEEKRRKASKERRERKKKKKKKARWHPLDSYEPLKERFRMGGCGLLVLIFVVLPTLVIGVLGWLQYNTFVSERGFEAVQQNEANVVDAPETDTFFWSWKLWQGTLYEAPETGAEIAIVGGTWWLGGTFKEKVYFRGYHLVLEDGARFEKGLDVNAVRFNAGEAVIEGELTGNIGLQK